MAATEADIQLFWGEPLDGVGERIARLKALSRELDRDLPPLEFGLRITTLVRDTTEQAWTDAEAKVAEMARSKGTGWHDHQRALAVGQQRLLELHERGDVLDDNLYTAPGKVGGGGAGTTWLVGSAEDVARSLRNIRISASPTSCCPTRRISPNQATGRSASSAAARLRPEQRLFGAAAAIHADCRDRSGRPAIRGQAAEPCCFGEVRDFATIGRAPVELPIRKAQMLSR
ncbi:LLM class flavin-dependent oxidoreductase [Rhizobium johnstonii]|uniref:LLM class flavin-dependent oxidoreductase n=1 Tax=Rhizobium johnstonii TaxID=3019933 RepID=UPI002FEF1A10